MKKLYLLTLFFVVIFSGSINILADSNSQYDINSPKVKEIADQFSMQGHADHDISTCQTMQTYYEEIVDLLNEGQTEEEILDYYYSMYGEEGLRAPKKEGFSLVAWITPFLALGVASIGLFIGTKNMMLKQKDKGLEFQSETKSEVEAEIMKSVIEEERKKYF